MTTPAAWHTIGWSGGDPSTRNVDPRILGDGWGKFVHRRVWPLERAGFRAHWPHNVFGCLAGENMQLDQYLHARRSGPKWLTEGFVEAWRPVVNGGSKVIAYLGQIPQDADFKKREGRGKVDDWLRRVESSLRPILDAGMELAIDGAAGEPPDSPTYWLLGLLKSLGTQVHIEFRPQYLSWHWQRWPIVITDDWWRKTVNDDTYLPAYMLGPVTRVIHDPPEGETWATYGQWGPPLCASIIRDGHTPTVSPDWFLARPGLSWSGFMGGH